MIELMRRAELETAATDQLDTAFKAGQWMAVVLRVKNGIISLDETTCDFPFGDFDAALRLIKQAIGRKLGIEPPSALPTAAHVTQLDPVVEQELLKSLESEVPRSLEGVPANPDSTVSFFGPVS